MRKFKSKLKKIGKKIVPVLGFIPVVGTALTVAVVVAKARRNSKDEKIAARAQAAEAKAAEAQSVSGADEPPMQKAKKFFAPVADFFGGLAGATPATGTSPVKSNNLPLIIGGALVLGLLGFLYMRKS